MKKIIYSIVITLAVLGIFACRSTDKAVIDPGPAGKIVIYTSMYEGVIEDIQENLKRKFPNCQIEIRFGGTGTLQARINQEMSLGSLGCDIMLVADPSYSLELIKEGMLHSYKSTEANNLIFYDDTESFWHPVRISNMVLAYNPARNSKNSIPNSFYNFAYDQSVKGAISMSNPLTSGTTLVSIAALKDKYGYEYFDALGMQDVHLDSSTTALSKLESGEYKVIMTLEETILNAREENGSKLEVIYPIDGAIVIPSTIMIINNRWNANKNIEAAEAITDWFLSAEGQNAIVAGWMHSPRANFNKIPHDSITTSEILSNSMQVNWENIYQTRDDILEKFEEFVTYREK